MNATKSILRNRYGAKGDGVTDDTSAIQNALNDGGFVFVPVGNYLISGVGLTVSQNTRIVGEGLGTIFTYSGTGTAITGGSRTASALTYGVEIENLRINLTNTAGNGIELAGTGNAVLRNIYIEGQPSTHTGTAVFLNGATAACIYTSLDGVRVSHVKRGIYLSAIGGTQVVTSVDSIGFRAVCDNIVGSVGIQIDATHGQGSRFIGGNLESCANAVITAGVSTLFLGIRFENTSNDVTWSSGASGNILLGALDLNTTTGTTNNSGNQNNQAIACMLKGAPQTPQNWTFGNVGLNIKGNIGFYGAGLTGKQTVTGSRGGNAALASLLTSLATIGLITDSSTA